MVYASLLQMVYFAQDSPGYIVSSGRVFLCILRYLVASLASTQDTSSLTSCLLAVTHKNVFTYYQMFSLEQNFPWSRTTSLDIPGPFGLDYYMGTES